MKMIRFDKVSYQYQDTKDKKQLIDIEFTIPQGQFLLVTGKSGQKQKVAIASCYCMKSKVYIMDEPSANLDPKAIREFAEMLARLKRQGSTIILIEHRLYYVKDLMDEMIYMEDGRIVERLTRKEALALSREELMARGLRVFDLDQIEKKKEKQAVEKADYLEVKQLAFEYKNKKQKSRFTPFWRAWLYSIIGGFRKKYQDPNEILGAYIKEGMTVADIGCGLGYFTLPMANKVGRTGKVVTVDLQLPMLKGLAKKAKKQHLLERIEMMCCSEHSLNISKWKEELDFVLVFAVAHEVPDRERLFKELAEAMKKGAKLLLAEPRGDVSEECFRESVGFAKKSGFTVVEEPNINMSRSIVLVKQ